MSSFAVAQRYDLTNTLLLNWKRRFGADPAFLPIEVVPEPAVTNVKPAVLDSKIEIQLCNGHKLSVTGAFNPDAVVRLLHGLSS